MTKRWTCLSGLAVAVIGAIAVAAWAEDEKDEELSVDQVPAAVRATIQAEGGQVEEIDRETADGKTIYEADVVKDGKEIELRIAEDGKLLSRKIEGNANTKEEEEDEEGDDEESDDEEGTKLAIDQVPAAVKATIQAEGGRVEDIERQAHGEKTIYEADVIKDGKEIELRIAEDGKLVSRKIEGNAKEKEEEDEEEGDDEDEREERVARGGGEAQMEARAAAAGVKALALAKVTLIEAVETAIAEVPGGKAYMVQLKTEDGKPRFEVQVITGDKRMEVAIDGITRQVLEIEPKGSAQPVAEGRPWRDSFKVDKANLGPTGKNPYWNLEPGYRLHYAGGKETLVISVLDETKVVDSVTTRVVEERESKNGQLVEVSRNFFAIDKATQDVYYFGEEVDIYRDGKVVRHEGAWLAGEKDARFGLMMPGKPVKGDRFYQEIAPREAMDRAEITSLDEKLVTPAGTFEHCVHIKETSPLERDVSHKVWAPGVGLIKDDSLVLVKIEKPGE